MMGTCTVVSTCVRPAFSITLAFLRNAHVQDAQHADLGGLLAAVAVALAGSLSVGATKAADGPQVAHSVFFKLKDNSGANRAKLAATCKLLLTGHEGTISFAAGTLAGDLNGPFNDHDFDVSLHLVFVSKAPSTSTTNTRGTRSSSRRTRTTGKRFAFLTHTSRPRSHAGARPGGTRSEICAGSPRQGLAP